MTITGEGASLVTFHQATAELEDMSPEGLRRVGQISDALFEDLQDDDVLFDTSTGLVEFTHPNAVAHARFYGTERAKRSLPDWVGERMNARDDAEIMWDFYFSILNGLTARVRERVDG